MYDRKSLTNDLVIPAHNLKLYLNDSSSNDNIAEETGTSALRSPATRASGRCGAAGAAAAPPAAQAPGRGGGG